MTTVIEPSETRVEQTACILCSRNCGLKVKTENGHFVSVRGDDAHVVSKGYLCQKAARLDHYQHHDDRLRHPLKRMPDGQFQRVGWAQALAEIAERLTDIRGRHGGDAFAFVGGGGQGNHLGGVYSRQLLAAMGSRYAYSSLAQEKTGDFWVNGRLFGHQTCHTTEDVEHADYVIFIGCNPYQSHGIPNARDTLRHLQKTPGRTMVVIDPRRTESARQAHIHLQLKPGTDAFLLSAMLAIIVREGLHDRDFIARHCNGFEAVEKALREIPVADHVHRADVPLADVERVARDFARAKHACVRVDLGVQHTLHCTLNGYLEKLLYLVTGHFGRRGCNNLHTLMLPMLGHTDEREMRGGRPLKRTAHHGMHPIAGMYPPNVLPDEILKAGDRRLRAVFVDSSNPVLTYADTGAQERAFGALDLLVVVDVAMTETARLAHYILPASTQFEKVEATGFNLEFPDNFFHLRAPVLQSQDDTLPEPEIYTRLLEAMGAIPRRFPLLASVAHSPFRGSRYRFYLAALGVTLALRSRCQPFAASILYRTLGPALPEGLEAAAFLLPLSEQYARRYREAVERAGHRDGAALFDAILHGRSGVILSRHLQEESWSLMRTPDRRVHLDVPEMLHEMGALAAEPAIEAKFVLMAGERRTYNANQIFRSPDWRKTDPGGALRMHPDDAQMLGVTAGDRVRCTTEGGSLDVDVETDDGLRRGVVTLPHGYGQRYNGGLPVGPTINRLTTLHQCDPLTKTPFHKHLPVRIEKLGQATAPEETPLEH
ncbi:MAG: molybdopterin-dependent oxidoreductase [Ramlibacter sp.]|nr:molybdopterin-dependent oxidoreductase [Ramlibacter sp.]